MAKSAAQTLGSQAHVQEWMRQCAIVIAASLFVALCAQITLPLPFTPVPLTMQNLGVLLVGMALGSKRGFAALALYLVEGASGMPVFNPTGLGGLAQLLGPTGGFLMAYPLVAGLAGWIMERGVKNFARGLVAATAAEIVLFAGGIGWLVVFTHSWARAVQFGFYWFIFAEIIKIMFAAGSVAGWRRFREFSE